MLSAIVFLPLLGFILAGVFGRQIGERGCEVITSTLVCVAALLSWVVFLTFDDGAVETRNLFAWIVSGSLQTHWAIRVDALTAVMLVVVNSVSALVHVYSIGYMHHDPHRPRFFAYLSLFTFAMLMLVTADNLLQLFFGWEGVGLASYLLIGFWYKKPSACAAAIKAFIVNRVGDFGFALGIFGVYLLFDSVEFTTIFANADMMAERTIRFLSWDIHAMTLLCLLLFVGAMGKSAQFILHTWLPDAMEGPTPVSALIHAATMVTAGIFMVARLSPLFELAPVALMVVTIMGAVTAFFAATVGLVQNDIKRVIAYSTCSQLGYMFAALGVGAYSVGIFHLFTHAFFKALLFLGAGSVIHAVNDEQDIRHMGGLREKLPITYWMMMIGTLALTGVGIPYLIGFAGFHSKDAIVEATWAAHSGVGNFAFWALVVAAFCTSFYSWRLMHLTFHGKTRAPADVYAHAHESPYVMTVPLGLLALGAVFSGLVYKGMFTGHGAPGFFANAMVIKEDLLEAIHHVPILVALAPTIAMGLGFALAWWFYMIDRSVPRRLAASQDALYKFLLNKWYIDEIYDVLLVRPTMALGRFLWKVGDGLVIDGLGPDGVAKRVLDVTARAVKLQTGYVYHYAFAMLMGAAALITWAMLAGGG